METICTIGYTKKSLREFIERLQDAGVDCVVDIRLHNTSQLAGFSKKEDLQFILEDGFGIKYAHVDYFAPTEEILSDYKTGKSWDVYTARYSSLIDEREMVRAFLDLAEDNGWRKPCLLCAEDEPDQCHRRLLAEAIAGEADGLEVRHL